MTAYQRNSDAAILAKFNVASDQLEKCIQWKQAMDSDEYCKKFSPFLVPLGFQGKIYTVVETISTRL